MNKWSISITVFIVLIIIYIYQLQYSTISCEQVFVDDLINQTCKSLKCSTDKIRRSRDDVSNSCNSGDETHNSRDETYNLLNQSNTHSLKTGDLILFKAYNNFNSLCTTSYFGHVGMVYIDDGIPLLFEANGIERVPLKPHHSKNGVFLSPLSDRIKKYKGRCYLKSLNKPLPPESIQSLKEFIDYAMNNMYYDYHVIKSGFKKLFGIEKCHNGTNCGEIMFLSLIKLGLLDIEFYDTCILNHLKFVCEITDFKNGYKYLDLVEIIDHPFAY